MFLALIVELLSLEAPALVLKNVLTFITLTSVPALLYAILVDNLVPIRGRRNPSTHGFSPWSLPGVSRSWWCSCAALLRFPGVAILVASLLPLVLIVVALTVLNLEHVVFNIMAGIPPGARSGNDLAYIVVATLASSCMRPVSYPGLSLARLSCAPSQAKKLRLLRSLPANRGAGPGRPGSGRSSAPGRSLLRPPDDGRKPFSRAA